MHRELLKAVNDMAGYALEALANHDHVRARRWLKEIQHTTSDLHIEALEAFALFEKANGDLPRTETIMAQAKGLIIEGSFTRGPIT